MAQLYMQRDDGSLEPIKGIIEDSLVFYGAPDVDEVVEKPLIDKKNFTFEFKMESSGPFKEVMDDLISKALEAESARLDNAIEIAKLTKSGLLVKQYPYSTEYFIVPGQEGIIEYRKCEEGE